MIEMKYAKIIDVSDAIIEQGYLDLIERVAKVDIQAALYLRHDARQLKSFTNPLISCLPKSDVSTAFRWAETPQGYDYWLDIAVKVKP